MVLQQRDSSKMGTTEVLAHHPYPSSSSSSSSSSLGEESRSNSQGTSCSSSDLLDDARSSSSTSMLLPDSSSLLEARRDRRGPLCELSDLMTHLPIKRGLSRHYSWKSRSFTSLASVRSIEDLAKEDPCAKRLKLCVGRGFEGGSTTDSQGRRSLSYGLNMGGAVMPRKRPSFLATSVDSRPPIPTVRTF